LQVEIITKEGLKRELNIEVPAEVVGDAYVRAYEQIRKKAKIDGFRPGKAPINVIRNRFKPEATAEIVDELINRFYHEAVREKKLEPVGTPVLTRVDVDEGKPLIFTLGIEVLPELEAIARDGLEVNEPDGSVADKDVDELLASIRHDAASLRTVNRAAEKSDVVICDLEPIAGAVEGIGDMPLSNQEIDLESPRTVEPFKKGLTGARQDEMREVILTYPENHEDKQFAGKTVTFRVVAKEIKERVLPELNDAFAKRVGMGETLLELRLSLRQRLEQERRAEIGRMQKRQIIDQMVGRNVFDVPETMVESYLKNIVEDHREHDPKADEKQIREKYRPAGINMVRWYLLYHRLAVLEKIEVSPEDTENWIKRFAENYRMDAGRAKEILNKTGRQAEIRDGILEDKVLAFLLSKATIKKGSTDN